MVSLETLRNRIDLQWQRLPGKMNWMGLEDDLRDILAHVNQATILPGEALRLISDAIGAHTGRGEPLDSAWTMNRYGKGID